MLAEGGEVNSFAVVLFPYKHQDLWVFDDARVGLVREPFVQGVPEILESLLKRKRIPLAEAARGFSLTFAATHFQQADTIADWVSEENGGNWYETREDKRRGWLCPALYRYFPEAPPTLWVSVESLS